MRLGAIALLGLPILSHVRATDVESLLLSLDSLPLDTEGHLAANYLLYSASCPTALVASLADSQDIRLTKAAASSVMSEFSNSECSLVCLQQGVPGHLIQHTLPYLIISAEDDGFPDNGSNWVSTTCNTVELGLVNNLDREASLLWVNPTTGNEILSGVLPVGGESEMTWIESHLGHSFVVRDSVDNSELMRINKLQHDTFLQVGPLVPSEGEPDFLDHVDERAMELLTGEWTGKDNVTRTFTGVGFAKGQLPRDIWASIFAFYYNNIPGRGIESFSYDILVNWWASESYLITMPPLIKIYWQSRLKTLVEAWAGIELELTDIYGVRQYEDKARLMMHVDRINTHAASVIINVHQEGMRSPWPVQIYDFANRLHEVNMEPGEILYYESARCLHGRMTPLHGSKYVNVFSHYRPKGGDPLWYKRDNPPGTPVHLSLDEDLCSERSPHRHTAVMCRGNGESLSFAVASEGEDLYDLWKYSADQ